MIYMKELNVREKENLISPIMYLAVLSKSNALLEIMQNFIENDNIISYFDIKDGVKYEHVIKEKWINNYQKVIDYCKERDIYSEPSEEEKDKEKFLCVAGIGASLCDIVNDILLECDTDCEKYEISFHK